MLGVRMSNVASMLARRRYLSAFGVDHPDIFVVSFPRSGTTMLQMLLIQLTTSGDADFDHLYDLSPWPDYAARNLQPLPELPPPRIVKVHEHPRWFRHARMGTFLLLFRDPADVVESYHEHLRSLSWPGPEFDTTFQKVHGPGRSQYMEFYSAWVRAGRELAVVPVSFESMVSDRERMARSLSALLGLRSSEEQIARAVARSSFEFMKSHQRQLGFRRPLVDQFVRKGLVGMGDRSFSIEQRNILVAQRAKLDELHSYARLSSVWSGRNTVVPEQPVR